MLVIPPELLALRPLLPESILGVTTAITPIRAGLSGAGVYAATTERGEYVLRVQDASVDGTGERSWARQLRVLRRAAEHGIAPAILYIDERAHSVVSARVAGVPLPAALGDPSQRSAAIGSVVAQLRALHAIDATDIDDVDPVDYARTVWQSQTDRRGFPSWVGDLNETFDSVAALLEQNPRPVVSHNDMNPGNVLWDGTRVWLVDWAVAGCTHAFYDLASFATFLNLDADTACGLLAAQERRPLDDSERATFTALRRLVALAAGCTFLGMVPDLTTLGAPARNDAPTLSEFYAQMRAGALDLSTPVGLGAFGLALLRTGTEPVN